MNYHNLKKILKEKGEPDFRYRQIRDAFAKRAVISYEEINNIPKSLANKLAEELPALSFVSEKISIAKNKKAFKALLRLSDGEAIESVLLASSGEDWSACVSSQAGCPLGCRFCATGRNGFKRNLSAEEICDQILFWQNFLKTKNKSGRVSSIVFMGMGEPFLNWVEVRDALKLLLDQDYYAFGSRHISVSTAGIPDGIKKFAKEFPQVNLALSLIFPNDQTRSEHMPINRKHSLGQIKKSLEYYLEKTNRKVFIEYVMLDGLNDDMSSLKDLIAFIESIEKGRKLLHVNLIAYNNTVPEFQPSGAKAISDFKNHLMRNKISVSIRKSLGQDIDGACGQLAGRSVSG